MACTARRLPRFLSIRTLNTTLPPLATPSSRPFIRKTPIPSSSVAARISTSSPVSQPAPSAPSPAAASTTPPSAAASPPSFADVFDPPPPSQGTNDFDAVFSSGSALESGRAASGGGGGGFAAGPASNGGIGDGGYRIPGEVPGPELASNFAGLSERPFPKEAGEVLMRDLKPEDVEIKPDGLLYLPEIKYRRILNHAFGPGGWGLVPRGETHVTEKLVSREWAMMALGRSVAVARGEQEYFDKNGISMATEGCKSNAMMRCCKDLGIASELWDPVFIREFKEKHCVEIFAEHTLTKRKKKLWRKKVGAKLEYPWKEGR